MHLRVSKVTRKGKTYAYAQFVESYRRESDGMPMHRVVANLGTRTPTEIENLKTALAAAKDGKRVVVARVMPKATRIVPKPVANLRYLDVAVLLEIWREWGLDDLINPLMPEGEADICPASVVSVLAVERCVDQGSKLYATRWFPRTALPELLGVAPTSFNNTRLHRVLDALDDSTSALMRRLPRRYEEREGAFASLFIDVTDAWFVGHGPALAEKGKTKEGLIQRKIGIVLLCNEHGYPLRWDVIPGNSADCTAMSDMLKSIVGLSWLGEAPIVCDRAMGKTAQIREMADSGLRFVTALTTPEFGAYSDLIPHARFASLEPRGGSKNEHLAEDRARAAQAAQDGGLQRVEDDLFVMDLGVVTRADPGPAEPREISSAASEAMRLCREVNQAVADGRHTSYDAAGRALGLGGGLTSKYRELGKLAEDIQRDILAGKAAARPLAGLIRIARIKDRDQQRSAFDALVDSPVPRARAARPEALPEAEQPEAPLRVRAVVYFNPDRFVDQRLRARRHVEEIKAFVAALNGKLTSPRSKLTHDGVAAAVDRKLRSEDLLSAFHVEIRDEDVAGRMRPHVNVTLDADEWARRRRYDGFTVLVAQSTLPHSAPDLARLYRAKDAVEKDFQVIKSLVDLRPIRHHTDGKVRAHVTICMLALLLERTLRRRLSGTSTPEHALEILATCHLNQYQYGGSDGDRAYTVTQPDAEQAKILRALGLQHLADDQDVADRITPR